MKRRVAITVETERAIVVTVPPRVAAEWCPACCSVVDVASPEQAAVRMRLSTRAVYRRIEEGSIHFLPRGASGVVCLASLGGDV
jgi:hypothetical protein